MIRVKKVKPLFNRIITTADKYKEVTISGTNLIDTKKTDAIKEYQRVVEVGTSVSAIKEGDLVLIDPTRYMQRKHREGTLKDGVITDNPITAYNFNMVELEGKDHLLLFDSDIIYVVKEYEEEPESNLVIPDKPEIII